MRQGSRWKAKFYGKYAAPGQRKGAIHPTALIYLVYMPRRSSAFGILHGLRAANSFRCDGTCAKGRNDTEQYKKQKEDKRKIKTKESSLESDTPPHKRKNTCAIVRERMEAEERVRHTNGGILWRWPESIGSSTGRKSESRQGHICRHVSAEAG